MRLVVSTGRGQRAPWADSACAEWGKRIGRWFPFEETDERVLTRLGPRARLIVLDERGQDLSSEGLAQWIEDAAQQSVTDLVFAIGGPYGHPPEVKERAWKTLRLSSMVLAHAVARVVLVEQIYRACSIRAGTPYHHAG